MARKIARRGPPESPRAPTDRARESRRRPFEAILRGAQVRARQPIGKSAALSQEAVLPTEIGGGPSQEAQRPQPEEDGDDTPLAAFTPPPPVLGALNTSVAEASLAPRSNSVVLAEVAAMAERMVTSMAIGRIGQDGHALKMKLSLGRGGTARVHLRLVGDELEVDLETEGVVWAEARALERALEERLDARVSLR